MPSQTSKPVLTCRGVDFMTRRPMIVGLAVAGDVSEARRSLVEAHPDASDEGTTWRTVAGTNDARRLLDLMEPAQARSESYPLRLAWAESDGVLVVAYLDPSANAGGSQDAWR